MANKELEKRYTELVLENDKLRIENMHLRGAAIPPCEGCELLHRHDCFTLHYCEILGFVDPNKPGCQKRKEKIPAAAERGEVGEIQKGNLLK